MLQSVAHLGAPQAPGRLHSRGWRSKLAHPNKRVLPVASAAGEAPKRVDMDDPSRYPDAPHLHQPERHVDPETNERLKAAGSPERNLAREQELDLHAVSHQDRAKAGQHTFPELLHGQPSERATSHEMTPEERQLMETHMRGLEEGKSGAASGDSRGGAEGGRAPAGGGEQTEQTQWDGEGPDYDMTDVERYAERAKQEGGEA